MQKSKFNNITMQKLRRLPRAGIIYAIRSEDIIAIKPNPLQNSVIKDLNSNNNKAISHQLSEASWNSSDSDETVLSRSSKLANKSDPNNDRHSPSITSDNFMEHLFVERTKKIKPKTKRQMNTNQNSLIVQRGSFGINVPSDGTTESSDTNDQKAMTNKFEKSEHIKGNHKIGSKHQKKRNGKKTIPAKPTKTVLGNSKSHDIIRMIESQDSVRRNEHNWEKPDPKTKSQISPPSFDIQKSNEIWKSENHGKLMSKTESQRPLPIHDIRKSLKNDRLEDSWKTMSKTDSQGFPPDDDIRKSKKNERLEDNWKTMSKSDSQNTPQDYDIRKSKKNDRLEDSWKTMSKTDSPNSPQDHDIRKSRENDRLEDNWKTMPKIDSQGFPPDHDIRKSKKDERLENNWKTMSKTDSQNSPPIYDIGKSFEKKDSINQSKPEFKTESRIFLPNFDIQKSKENHISENHLKTRSRTESGKFTQGDLRSRKPLVEVQKNDCEDYSDSSGQIYQDRANDDLLAKYQEVSMELSRLKIKYNELVLENSTVKQFSENLTMETENLKYENCNVKTRNETLAAKNLENQNLSRIIENLNRKVKDLCSEIYKFQTVDSAKTRRLVELESQVIELQEKSSSCKIDMEHLRGQLVQKELELKRLTHNQKVDEEKDLQMKLIHNELIELKGNIRVLCRIKPEPNNLIQIINNESLQLPPQRCKSFCPIYNFNRVFKTNSSQSEVFSEVRQLITSFVDGYNVNMITYGQSGSGKTFTMIGSKDHPGIVTHSIREVFKLCNQRTTWNFKICLSVLEIYNETIFDLLTTGENPKPIWRKRTQIHDDGKCIHIKGLSEIEIKHEEELLSYVLKSGKNRSSCMTTLNNDSSRSHLIVMLRIHGRNTFQNCSTQGVLMLCDLAGSENCTSSLSENSMTESKYISKSLTVLGRVFEALYNKLMVIPFRDSKLTHILKPSLTGDAKFAFIVTISGKTDNLNNTIRVLNLARKVAQISLGQPRKNTINAVGKAIGRAELLCQSG